MGIPLLALSPPPNRAPISFAHPVMLGQVLHHRASHDGGLRLGALCGDRLHEILRAPREGVGTS